MIEKKMLKDKWAIPVPAEYSQSIGLEKGGKVYIDLDNRHDRIIIQSDNIDREENTDRLPDISKVENDKEFTEREIADLIIFILNDNARIKSKVATFLLNKTGRTHFTPAVETCGHCGRPLKTNEKLIVNGKRICSDCKKIEVQKFLLYLERRKLDAEEREERIKQEN